MCFQRRIGWPKGILSMTFRNAKNQFFRPSLMLGASMAALIAASPAMAQTTPEPTPETAPPEAVPAPVDTVTDDLAAAEGTIVVTGSRIRRPNLESVVPVTSVTGEEFFETGQTS